MAAGVVVVAEPTVPVAAPPMVPPVAVNAITSLVHTEAAPWVIVTVEG